MRIVAAAFGAFLLLISAGSGRASSLSVTPIRLVLSTTAPLSTFTVINEGPVAARVQLSMNVWTQANAEDLLSPTRQVLANPTIFEVAGQSRQIVRLGLQAPAQKTERSYRLVVQEVPTASQLKSGTIGVLLRFSVPLFVPVEGAVATLGWKVGVNGREGSLQIDNSGGRHAQITSYKISRGGKIVSEGGVSTYVLPGASMRIPIKFAAPVGEGDTLRIDARTDDGDVHADARADRS